jgi:hypothetical protein
VTRRLVKELEKAKKRFMVRLKQRAAREAKDTAITFEELGVDQLFVDEAEFGANDGIGPEVRAFGKPVPRRHEVRRREYDPPDLDDTDVNDEEMVRNKSGLMMGQGP